jgi:hypothetical protein
VIVDIHGFPERHDSTLRRRARRAQAQFGETCGFGANGKPAFWIGVGPASFQSDEPLWVITPAHGAFAAKSRCLTHDF